MLERILTGGQTGADQGALRAARAAGLATGGWAPLGWATEDGPAPFLEGFGLVECPEPGYEARRRNVEAADGVLLFGDRTSPGSRGLAVDCERHGRPMVWVRPGVSRPGQVVAWLTEAHHIRTVMVAGNRESRLPGIGERVELFLGVVFRQLRARRPRG